jgi:hypothetical protein
LNVHFRRMPDRISVDRHSQTHGPCQADCWTAKCSVPQNDVKEK